MIRYQMSLPEEEENDKISDDQFIYSHCMCVFCDTMCTACTYKIKPGALFLTQMHLCRLVWPCKNDMAIYVSQMF